MTDRPVTEPRTAEGRKLADSLPGLLRAILAIEAEARESAVSAVVKGMTDLHREAEAAQGAAPSDENHICAVTLSDGTMVQLQDAADLVEQHIIEGAAPRAEGPRDEWAVKWAAFVESVTDLLPDAASRNIIIDRAHDAATAAEALGIHRAAPRAEGLDPDAVAAAFRKMANVGHGFDARMDSGEIGTTPLIRPSDLAAEFVEARRALSRPSDEG